VKKNRLRLFAFRPEHYREMEAYLQEMAAQGWKLRWCRGVLASFEPMGDRALRYAVDPHAMTSLAYFRRYPKARLQQRMQEGWRGAAKSKGCQILCTPDPDLKSPVPEQDLAPLVRNTCRLASMLWVLLLLAALWWLLSKPAVVYSVILTNLYLVLAALAVFLLLYHAVNIVLLTLPPSGRGDPRCCKRYLIHSGMLLFLLLAATSLELGSRNDMLFYFSLPILMVVAGIALLSGLSGTKDVSRLFPVVIVFSVLMFALIIFGNTRLRDASIQWSTQERAQLLERAGELPVLHLSDFGETPEPQQAVQTNRSILGDNLLYAEQSDAGYVFTNYTVTRSPFLAKQIFQYLYQQAQLDFSETFAEAGEGLYVLKQANTGLFQEGSSVYYFTLPEGNDLQTYAELLLTRSGSD